MSKFLKLSLLITAVLLIIACGLSTPSSSTTNTFAGQTTGVALIVVSQPTTYTTAGQQINYNFVVTNNSTAALAGPVTITDDKMAATCPAVNTVGNKNDNLDPAESVTCTASYLVTATDVTNGSVTNNSRARAGTLDSNTVNTVVRLAENKVLALTVSAAPTTYSAANQLITYTYSIKNTGTTTLGPTQFIVRDDRFPNPLNCQSNATIIAANESVTCSQTYTTTTADMSVAQIVNTVTASGGGAGTIQAASATVTNTTMGGGASPGNYTKGSTIQHDVKDGEWMMQIARCYGANIDATIKANPQVVDPNMIFPANRVTVPNIGSVTGIHGPPCVTTYTVKSGDTWDSIANDPNHNASVAVLMEANQGVSLSNGRVIKIPVNSKIYGSSTPVAVVTATTPGTNPSPVRLNFPAGSPKVTISGSISTPQTLRHVFTGATGQQLTVKLTVPTNDVNLAIYAPNGASLKVLDLTNSWSGTLTASGDHYIDLVSTLGSTAKQYTLEVTLITPTAPSLFERVADINSGGGDSGVSHLRSFGTYLYFQANANDGAGVELWRYDPGLKALSRVWDINAGAGDSKPAFLTSYGDMLYFAANGNDNGGNELWRFNGSAVGRVTDMNGGAADANPMYLTVFNNVLYFRATGGDGKGAELWKYDGTVSSRVTDINPDAGDSNPSYLTVFKNALYFGATSTDGGTELWKYDGSTASRVADIHVGVGNSNPAFLTVFNNLLYFSANGNDNTGTELWKYDGTNPPARAADVNPGAIDSVPTYLVEYKGALYFSANGDTSGFELWKFDGTTASRVSDLNPAGNANPAWLAVHNNELYFQANANDGVGAELWKYKGP